MVIAMLLNLAFIVYLGLCQPWKPRPYNRLEMFNEYFTMLCTFLLVSFSEFGPDVETKFMMGWVLSGVLFFMCLVNLYFVL